MTKGIKSWIHNLQAQEWHDKEDAKRGKRLLEIKAIGEERIRCISKLQNTTEQFGRIKDTLTWEVDRLWNLKQQSEILNSIVNTPQVQVDDQGQVEAELLQLVSTRTYDLMAALIEDDSDRALVQRWLGL